MVYSKDYLNPTIKEMLGKGLEVGDKLYAYMCKDVAECHFVRVVDEQYVELQFPNEPRPFRTTMQDNRWNTDKIGCLVSAYFRIKRWLTQYEIDLRYLEKYLKDEQVPI